MWVSSVVKCTVVCLGPDRISFYAKLFESALANYTRVVKEQFPVPFFQQLTKHWIFWVNLKAEFHEVIFLCQC